MPPIAREQRAEDSIAGKGTGQLYRSHSFPSEQHDAESLAALFDTDVAAIDALARSKDGSFAVGGYRWRPVGAGKAAKPTKPRVIVARAEPVRPFLMKHERPRRAHQPIERTVRVITSDDDVHRDANGKLPASFVPSRKIRCPELPGREFTLAEAALQCKRSQSSVLQSISARKHGRPGGVVNGYTWEWIGPRGKGGRKVSAKPVPIPKERQAPARVPVPAPPAAPEAPCPTSDARFWPQIAGVPFDTGDVQTREVLMTSVMMDAKRKEARRGDDHRG